MKKTTCNYLLLIILFLFAQLIYCQGSIKYDSKTKSINVNSGAEGTVSILVKYYGSSTDLPVFLETMSCGNSDGLQIFSYSNGSILSSSVNETNIVFKFKKTVSSDTQVIYKFSTNGKCSQDESDMIKIAVNYKAQVEPNPTPSQFQNIIAFYQNQVIPSVSSLSIDEWAVAPIITGIDIRDQNAYVFRWEKKNSNGVWEVIPEETSDFIFPGILLETTEYRRIARKSGFNNIGQETTSNVLTLNAVPAPPAQEIGNNVITLYADTVVNGRYNIYGSTPTGGIGYFKYEYYAYNEYEGEVIGEVQMVGTSIDYQQRFIGNLPLKFYRKVYSKNKVSFSNTVTILPIGSSARMRAPTNTELNSSDLTVYPNPTTEVVNFAINFSTNKEIEIVVYSESIRNEKSVFKGTVTPNQVVNWNIPSDYQKGIYFYKILSGSKEVKTGKIIVQ